MDKFKVKLKYHFPFEGEVKAKNEKDAIDKTLDLTMDYLEDIFHNSRKFEDFWEHLIDYDLEKISKCN